MLNMATNSLVQLTLILAMTLLGVSANPVYLFDDVIEPIDELNQSTHADNDMPSFLNTSYEEDDDITPIWQKRIIEEIDQIDKRQAPTGEICKAKKSFFIATFTRGAPNWTFKKGETVKYNYTIPGTNNDTKYSTSTGEYEAPEDGTYIFDLHALGKNGVYLSIQTETNKGIEDVNGLTLAGDASHDRNSASTSAFVDLDAGDKVRVVNHENNAELYPDQDGSNSFSGGLVRVKSCYQ